MIPVQLTIEGLYSYQKRQTIDFSKLTNAGLFGIFGTVGSGKSSILEAITFTVYGRTDRLNLSGDNRNYNMMNLKSNELFIDFIFETGKEQTSYRAVVKGRRNSKRFEDVRALERLAYRKEKNDWIPVETQVLEQAIGLSYENFKRTIIIPQGQFQEFLQLGSKDRTQMMKELFHLERFELFNQVNALESKNSFKKQNLEGQLHQLGDLDPDLQEKYRGQLELLKKEFEEQTKKLEEDQKQEITWNQLKDLSKKLSATEVTLKQLTEEEPAFLLLEKSILEFEKCKFLFSNLIDSLDTSDRKIGNLNRQIGQEAAKLKETETEILATESIFENVKSAFEKREELKANAEELTKILRIRALQLQITKGQERLKKGNAILQETIDLQKRQNEEREKMDLLVRQEKVNLPDLNMLSKIKTWHVERRSFERQAGELDKEQKRQETEREKLNSDFQSILKDDLFADCTVTGDIEKLIQWLHTALNGIKKSVKELESEADHFRLQEKLEAYAVVLKDGEACPLCGALHHPLVYSASGIKEEKDRLKKKRELLDLKSERINTLIISLNGLVNRREIVSGQLKQLNDRRKELEKNMTAHQLLFQWNQFKEEQEVEKAFTLAEKMQLELKQKEKNLDLISKQLEKSSKNKDIYKTELDKINMELTVSETEYKMLKEQLLLLLPEQYNDATDEQIERERKDLLDKYDRVEKQYKALNSRMTGLTEVKNKLAGSIETSRKELGFEYEQNKKNQQQFAERLVENGYSKREDVVTVLNQTLNLDQEKQRLSLFKQNLAVTRLQVSQFKKEMGDRSYDAGAHQKLLEEIKQSGTKIAALHQEKGRLDSLIFKLEKDIKTRKTLIDELEKLNARSENIRTLKSLFKGNGFVNYISSVHLQNLCRAANDRFYRLTRQKLSLEVSENNDFQVRDFMNGGKVRNVKTLSGGQTFQAALSLALALADNIQQITGSNQNFFFLDEGFGSLDKDSLAVVFDSLMSLRKENRIVGVISHVEEMQQEIDVHLRIDISGEEGSIIHRSWQE